MSDAGEEENFCWVTLVTKPSYLPGAIILAHSLAKVKSKYPLIVMWTMGLTTDGFDALKNEAKENKLLIPHFVLPLIPRKGQENTGSVAARFADTFTKLQAFEVFRMGYTRAVFLDADMAVFRNPDAIFQTRLPDSTWIAGNHSCVCNLDDDKWAAKTWTKGNCAYTPLVHPDQVAAPLTPASRPTWRLLNGGMFLFHPSEELWKDLVEAFNTSKKLKSYQFPDQEFLADFFQDKWTPISWKYNALKTMRYVHPRLWSDDEVAIVHYIVDKPWDRPIVVDGIAGHLGRDAVTHEWWWELYRDWLQEGPTFRRQSPVIDYIKRFVAQERFVQTIVPLPQAPGEPGDVIPHPQVSETTKPIKPSSSGLFEGASIRKIFRLKKDLQPRAMST